MGLTSIGTEGFEIAIKNPQDYRTHRSRFSQFQFQSTANGKVKFSIINKSIAKKIKKGRTRVRVCWQAIDLEKNKDNRCTKIKITSIGKKLSPNCFSYLSLAVCRRRKGFTANLAIMINNYKEARAANAIITHGTWGRQILNSQLRRNLAAQNNHQGNPIAWYMVNPHLMIMQEPKYSSISSTKFSAYKNQMRKVVKHSITNYPFSSALSYHFSFRLDRLFCFFFSSYQINTFTLIYVLVVVSVSSTRFRNMVTRMIDEYDSQFEPEEEVGSSYEPNENYFEKNYEGGGEDDDMNFKFQDADDDMDGEEEESKGGGNSSKAAGYK